MRTLATCRHLLILHPACISGVLGITLTLLTGAATASSPIPNPNADWLQRSEQIIERAATSDESILDDPAITKRQRQWARKIKKITEMKLRESAGAAAAESMFDDITKHPLPLPSKKHTPSSDHDTVRVFVTLGDIQGEASAKARERFLDQLRTLSNYEHSMVLLRGLPPGMKHINQLMGLMLHITRKLDDPPPIKLAPLRFREAGITSAPTVVLYRDGEAIARLRGSLEIGWLKDQVEDGQRGKLGVRGTVRQIAERNLMAVIHDRWNSMNWAKMKKQAVAAYWNAYAPPTLPEADESRRYTVDAAIVMARTIRGPKGRVIAHKGQRIDPLEIVPFTGAIIAFNGGDPEQVKLANHLADKVRSEGLRPILLTQGLPGDKANFDALSRLEQTLGHQVYLLKTNIIERFDIQALPAVVRGRKSLFVVHELAPEKALARLATAGDTETQP